MGASQKIMNAIDQLRDEHKAVRVMLSIWRKIVSRMEKGQNVSVSDMDNLLGFMKGFVDHCHHEKEESYLFPALMVLDNPQVEGMVKTLTQDHGRFHILVQDLSRAMENYKKGDLRARQKIIETLKEYVAILADHEEKETTALFKLAEEYLTKEVQGQLEKDFERVELGHNSAGRHEQFQKMLDRIQQSYNS